jgi:hypothetical protein
MSKILDSLELKLRRILEGSLDGLFFPSNTQSLSSQLTGIILKAVKTSLDETEVLPDFIQLRVSPEKFDAWQSTQPVLDQVSQEIMKAFKDESVKFEKPLRLHLLADDSLGVDEIKVIPAQHSQEQITTTTVNHLSPEKNNQPLLPEQACLIGTLVTISSFRTLRFPESISNSGQKRGLIFSLTSARRVAHSSITNMSAVPS